MLFSKFVLNYKYIYMHHTYTIRETVAVPCFEHQEQGCHLKPKHTNSKVKSSEKAKIMIAK